MPGMNIASVYHDVKVVPVYYKIDADDEAVTTDEVDTRGYEGCAFYAVLGRGEVKAAAITTKVQQDTATGMASAADLEDTGDTAATAVASDATVLTDIKKPQERYLRMHITVADMTTAAALTVTAILYNPVVRPVTQVVDSAEFHLEPDEGTA